jgi:hypothetical protein
MQEKVAVEGEVLNKPEVTPAVKVYLVKEPLEYNGAQYPEGARIQLTDDDAAEVSGSVELIEGNEDVAQPTAAAPTPIEDADGHLADNMSDEDGDGENAGDQGASTGSDENTGSDSQPVV